MMEDDIKPFTCKPSVTVWLASLAALMNAASVGLCIGFQAAGFDDLKYSTGNYTNKTEKGEDFFIDGQMDWGTENASWFAAIVSIGALFGALTAGPVLTKLGPKLSVIASNVPYLICWIMVIFGENVTTLVIGRFLGGLSIGFSSGAVPVYCIEISTPSIRGTLGAAFQLFCNVGVLLAALIGYGLHYKELCAISALACIVGPIVLFFMPESPIFLYGKYGAIDSKPLILNALRRLRTPDSNLESEFRQIALARSLSGAQKLILGFNELRDPKVYKPLLISLALMLSQQLSGVNAVIFFQLDIFKETGSSLDPKIVAIITGLGLTISCLIGSVVVDKVGRKTFLFYTGIGLLITLMTLALYFQFKPTDKLLADEYGSKYGMVALIGMEGFLFIFSLALGPIPWMMVPEMTPYSARTFITAVAVGFNWFLVFIITKNFAKLSLAIGSNGAFYLFSSFVVVALVFIRFILRETKGLTNEQLEKLFD